MTKDVELGFSKPGDASGGSEQSGSSTPGMMANNKGFEPNKDPIKAAPALPPPAPSIMPTSSILAPPEVYKWLAATGMSRVNSDYFTLAAMGLAAGAYIAFAFSFCAAAVGTTGVTLLGALAFPTGLLLIILCGGDLYTGNTCFLFSANLEGQATVWHHIKHVVGTYFWNLVGNLVVVGFMLGGSVWRGRENYVHSIAHTKMALSFGEALCRGVLANWMVNLALWQAACARDVVGKAVGCWVPVTAFVCIGLEHCIANMFIIPMSIYLPPTEKYPFTITWAGFIRRNLVPATIGNWIGGAIMVAFLQGCIFGRTVPAFKNKVWDATLGRYIKELP